ncbi:MAG: SLATT domain-containing protein, partial [Chloroflexi bacterium]
DDNILEKINAVSRTGDNGLRPLTLDDYLKHRVNSQLTWYINKISDDFASARKSNAIIITVSAVGSLLATLGSGLEVLVALTAALAFALSRMAEIRLYGATYAIYHSAAARLQVELGRWLILPAEERQKKEKQSDFVVRVEEVFADEMKQWREQAIRQLEANEQSILQNLQQARESLKDMDESKLLTLHEQEDESEAVASSEG